MTNRLRALCIILAVATLSAAPTFAKDAWWMVLERGKRAFRGGDLSEALMRFDDASRQRDAYFKKLYDDLLEGLSLDAVRRYMGSLAQAEQYFTEKKLERYLAPLRELRYYVDFQKLEDSSDKALEKLDELRQYPEADFWLGEVFRAEGEYAIALKQYQKAWDSRARLDTPEVARDILYRLADIHERRSEMNEMVANLNDVVKEDAVFSSPEFAFLGKTIATGIPREGIDKFLQLYRLDKPDFYEAHRKLGLYYCLSGRHDEASRHLTFAFLISSTVLIDSLRHDDFQWSYTTFADLLTNARKDGELASYMDSIEYYRTLYYLAVSMYFENNSYKKAANGLWTVLAQRVEAGEWQKRAQRQLKAPFQETAIFSR